METKNRARYSVCVSTTEDMKRLLMEHRRRGHLCQAGLRKGRGGSGGWGGFSGRENACASVGIHACDHDCVSRSDYMWVCAYFHILIYVHTRLQAWAQKA